MMKRSNLTGNGCFLAAILVAVICGLAHQQWHARESVFFFVSSSSIYAFVETNFDTNEEDTRFDNNYHDTWHKQQQQQQVREPQQHQHGTT